MPRVTMWPLLTMQAPVPHPWWLSTEKFAVLTYLKSYTDLLHTGLNEDSVTLSPELQACARAKQNKGD